VRAGFVVVAPFFPTRALQKWRHNAARIRRRSPNEAGDLTFVTRSVLQASANETTGCPIVSGLVEPSEIALAGHSDGAEVVGMLATTTATIPKA